MNSSQINPPLEIRLTPIGMIHSQFKQATGTPIQPCRAGNSTGYVVMREEFTAGLADLAGFDRVWLIYYFHRATAAKMSVVPYRDTVERGLFATRVPARPNPVGMSCVRLLDISGNILRLAEVDILDNTPLLDLKPYVPHYDNYPVQRCGWLDTVPDKPVVADDRFERKDAQTIPGSFPTPLNHTSTTNSL
jgi:tRNA-Thr(GGU) m(6)t(6)A37 methyltransferase TsaA